MKIPCLLKYLPLFGLKTQIFQRFFVIAFEKMCFIPGSGSRFVSNTDPDPDCQKSWILIRNTGSYRSYRRYW